MLIKLRTPNPSLFKIATNVINCKRLSLVTDQPNFNYVYQFITVRNKTVFVPGLNSGRFLGSSVTVRNGLETINKLSRKFHNKQTK